MRSKYNRDSKRQRAGVRRRNLRSQADSWEKLGQSMSSASKRLYKILLLDLATALGLHYCHQCGEPIVDPVDLSIEHKKPWRSSSDPIGLFFARENLALSHFSCNRSVAWRGKKPRLKTVWGRFISYERYHEALSYDPDTGRLIWKIQSGRMISGDEAGRIPRGLNYRVVTLDGVIAPAHHIIWFMQTGKWSGLEIDHWNRNKADNAWTNLREATKSQQAANSGPTGKYKKGVSKNANCSTFQANIKVRGKRIYLGCFKTEDKAHAAWFSAAKYHFGEFATAT